MDYELLIAAERWAGANGGFETEDPGHQERVVYTPGTRIDALADEAVKLIGDRKQQVDRMLDLLAPLSAHECGVRATLFNAWDSLIREGKRTNDRDIIRVCRHEWHESKKNIPDKTWFTAIRWLGANNMRPKRDQGQRLLRDLYDDSAANG